MGYISQKTRTKQSNFPAWNVAKKKSSHTLILGPDVSELRSFQVVTS